MFRGRWSGAAAVAFATRFASLQNRWQIGSVAHSPPRALHARRP
jgi:hypothetical protein